MFVHGKWLLMIGAMIATCGLTGCNIDPPSDGVQVVLDQKLTDEQYSRLKSKIAELTGTTSRSSASSTVNGVTKVQMNFSPVDDPKGFADKLKFAEIVKIEENVITIKVKPNEL